MIESVSQWPEIVAPWLLYELFSQLISHPIDAETKEPVRPALSVLDYLLYNPGTLRGGQE